MRFDIRTTAFVAIAAAIFSSPARGEALTEILRTAALKNGLRPAAQLYDPKDAALADIGKTFFESKNVSLNGNISCRTCHLDEFSSADGLPNAIGIFGEGEGPARANSNGKIVPRNTLALWARGSKGFETFFWDGKIDFSNGQRISQFGAAYPSDDALLTAVHLPPLEIREMLNDDASVSRFKKETERSGGALLNRVVDRLRSTESPALRELARQTSKQIDELTFKDIARSIAAFIRSAFRMKDTKFHGFVFGKTTLDENELRGGLIFYGKGKCVNCHNGPFFSDLKFHAVPFPQIGFGKNGFGVDYGRFNVTFDPADLYRFRTPPLLNVHKTAPYGHSGGIAKLREAIVGHFDPLRLVDVNAMDALARHELFKRMAASKSSLVSISYLDDTEVRHLEKFLMLLSFDEQSKGD